MKKLTATSLLLIAGLAACAKPGEEATFEAMPEIDEKIAVAMEKASDANVAIAEVEVATAAPERAGPGQTVPPGVVLPPEAVQPVTVDWQGAVEPFLEEMATRAGYSFIVTGDTPANPMLISITANEEPLFGVVRRAGAMAHGYADIAFNPGNQTIEIRYGG